MVSAFPFRYITGPGGQLIPTSSIPNAPGYVAPSLPPVDVVVNVTEPGADLRDTTPYYPPPSGESEPEIGYIPSATGHTNGFATPVQTGIGQGVGDIMTPGEDLRDAPQEPPSAGGGGVAGLGSVAVAGPAVGIAVRLAMTALRRIMGSAVVVTRRHWDALPGWGRQALTAAGIYIGFNLAQDIPGVPGGGFDLPGGGTDMAHFDPHMVGGHLGAHVVGGWMANGVPFLRLSDGKLAAQKRNGSWKVWMPKKPIVIMPTGASNLRTLLRADAVLTRQSKKIATMLQRRAPRGSSRKKEKPGNPDVVVVQTKS